MPFPRVRRSSDAKDRLRHEKREKAYLVVKKFGCLPTPLVLRREPSLSPRGSLIVGRIVTSEKADPFSVLSGRRRSIPLREGGMQFAWEACPYDSLYLRHVW